MQVFIVQFVKTKRHLSLRSHHRIDGDRIKDGRLAPQHAHVAALAPSNTPRHAQDPIARAGLRSVAHKLRREVDLLPLERLRRLAVREAL